MIRDAKLASAKDELMAQHFDQTAVEDEDEVSLVSQVPLTE